MTRGHPTNVVFLALLFCYCECWAASECGIVNQSPSVRPHNSKYLEVSWKGLFSKNCSENELVQIEVRQITPSSNIDEDPETIARNLSDEKVLLKKNPCHQYDIGVRLVSTGARTTNNEYNFAERKEKVFGGYLKEKLEENFCANRGQPWKMIPDRLKQCVNNISFSENDQIVVSVEIWNPKHFPDKNKKIRTEIMIANVCSASNGPSSTEIGIYVGAGCAALIALVIIALACKKCQTKAATPQKEESDLNDMYGQYEFDDINGELVRMGSAWGTDASPGYGGPEDDQKCQGQVMDRNEYYV